jgi:Cellulase (glycosyl hydrolase family 5)
VLRLIAFLTVVAVFIAVTIPCWSTYAGQTDTSLPSPSLQTSPLQLRNLGMVAKLGKAKEIDDEQISLMKALGVQIVIWTPGEWAENETTPGQYRLNPEVRRVANEIASSDMKMVLLLFRKNSLYRNPLDADAFARYCGWMATTFRGMPVAAYQIWNEPSNFDVREYYGGAWNGRGHATWVSKFSDMVEKAAQAIRRADPDATITTSFEGPPLIDAMEEAAPDFANVDGISFHPYPGTLPAERVPWGGMEIYLRDGVSVADSDGSLVSTLNIQGTVDPERYLRRPLQAWVTEYGFPTCDQTTHPEHFACVSEDTQASFHVRGLVLGLSQGVKVWAPYELADDGQDPRDVEQNFGITYSAARKFKPKAAYLAIQRTAATMGRDWEPLARPDATFQLPGGTIDKPGFGNTTIGPQMVWFKTGQKYIAFLWLAGPMSSETQNGQISIRADHANAAKIINLVTGTSETKEVIRVSGRVSVDAVPVSSQPVALELSQDWHK